MAASDSRLFAIDAINLLEGGLDQICDRTVAVTSPLELRVRRIMAPGRHSGAVCPSAHSPPSSRMSTTGASATGELNNDADTAEAFQAEARKFFQRLIETIKEEKEHGKA